MSTVRQIAESIVNAVSRSTSKRFMIMHETTLAQGILDRDELIGKLVDVVRNTQKHLRGCPYDIASGDEGDFCTCDLSKRRKAIDDPKVLEWRKENNR